jgi:hypothetical protein
MMGSEINSHCAKLSNQNMYVNIVGCITQVFQCSGKASEKNTVLRAQEDRFKADSYMHCSWCQRQLLYIFSHI